MKLKTDTTEVAPDVAMHDIAMAHWSNRCDTLVTCLCMGGRFYAKERSSLGADLGADLEPIATGSGVGLGGTIMVRPTRYRHSEEERARMAAKAEGARTELARQTGIPSAKWSALANEVMRRKDLIGWLCARGLLPIKPVDQAVNERIRRSGITEEQRMKNTEGVF